VIITPDSSILVRASVRSNGPARRLIDEVANNPEHILAISPYILGEVGTALAYSKLQAVLHLAPEEIHAHLARLRRIARVSVIEMGLPVVLNDPKDDPIVYTAVGAGANVLCTRDRDFHAPNVISFCRRYGIEVLDDLELLLRITARSASIADPRGAGSRLPRSFDK
jgi:putative PIN family toxin of toxin-antitoxin system